MPNNFWQKLNKTYFKILVFGIILVISGYFYFGRLWLWPYFKQPLVETPKNSDNDKIQEHIQSTSLSECLNLASAVYFDKWYQECRRLNKISQECIDIYELSFNDYLDKYKISAEEYRGQRGIIIDGEQALISDYLKRRTDECLCGLVSDVEWPNPNNDPIMIAAQEIETKEIKIVNDIIDNYQEDRAACFKKYSQN